MKKVIIFFLLLSSIYGEDIENLLNDIEKKTDFSQKTKIENSGVRIIYTRDELERMQVRYLSDLLKGVFPYSYDENKFGFSDPNKTGSSQPFNSSTIRIMIDNQEIGNGFYGSGLFALGNIDMEFVDHVEIYSVSPSYEFSSEPSFRIIKLYTKKASKDNGSKINISTTNYGGGYVGGYNAGELNDFDYLVYSSLDFKHRQTYESHNTDLSRDKKNSHFLASFYDDNQRFLAQVIVQDRDSFIDHSMDATPLVDKIWVDMYHFGYDVDIDENLYLSFSYDGMVTTTDFKDDAGVILTADSKEVSDVFNGGLRYNYKVDEHQLIAGVNYREKHYKYKYIFVNGVDYKNVKQNNQQNILSVFLEDQYSYSLNSIITFGLKVADVSNKHSEQDDTTFDARLAYTYTNEDIVSKTILSKISSIIDPYLVDSNFYATSGTKKPSKHYLLLQQLSKMYNKDKYTLSVGLSKIEDMLFVTETSNGKIDNYNKDINSHYIELKYEHPYNQYDNLFLQVGYIHMNNLPFVDVVNQYTAVIRNINTYKKFDIFNEIIYFKDSKDGYVNAYDYSAGVKYHYSEDLIFSIKGENIFDKAKKTQYVRINPTTYQTEAPLNISPTDQKVTIGLEYSF